MMDTFDKLETFILSQPATSGKKIKILLPIIITKYIIVRSVFFFSFVFDHASKDSPESLENNVALIITR